MSKSEELEYVDFEVAKEDWTVFKLEDETLLKSRFTVGAILKKKGTVGEYNVNQNLFTVAIVPKNLWGPPATQKYSREDMFRSIEKEDVKFQCVSRHVECLSIERRFHGQYKTRVGDGIKNDLVY